MLQGNQVKDENRDVALFQELGSKPATFEAGAACDAYGLFAGHDAQHAYVEQAYVQTRLGVTFPLGLAAAKAPFEALVSLLLPIRPFVLDLYGHPDAGGYWEQ